MVNTINTHNFYDSRAVDQNLNRSTANNNDRGSTATKAKVDTVNINQSQETPVTYSSSISPEQMAEMSFDSLRQLVTNLLKEQGIDYKIAAGGSEVDISQISQEEAQELISEDGYFSVEQTSDRIVDFAVGLAGGDISKLDAIKKGVEQGFNEALEAFGGSLPEISYETLDAVMEKLDAWAAESHGEVGQTIR